MPRTQRILALGLTVGLLAAACTADAPPAAIDRLESIPGDAVKVLPANDLSPSILHSDEWRDPIPLEGPINTAGGEDSPFITPDGQSLYFFFTPDVSVPAEQQLGDGATGIWVSHLDDTGAWGEATRVVLSDPNDDTLDGCEFVTGDTMWFCSARRGNLRSIDIYTAQLVDGTWANWEGAGEVLNLDYLVGELHISVDGTALYYHTEREGGMGGMDIWLTRFVEGAWQEPENVSAVNTADLDGWPFLSQDGTELWITRIDQGTPALYRSTLTGTEWSIPELIVSQFAGEATLDAAGNLYFTHHFYDGTAIEADIYVAYRQ